MFIEGCLDMENFENVYSSLSRVYSRIDSLMGLIYEELLPVSSNKFILVLLFCTVIIGSSTKSIASANDTVLCPFTICLLMAIDNVIIAIIVNKIPITITYYFTPVEPCPPLSSLPKLSTHTNLILLENSHFNFCQGVANCDGTISN